MRRAPFWSAHACRRSTTALAQGSISSQRLSFRPGFLGRGLNGRYPPSPVPVQGCTSHPGHNAGKHDAQAAREQTANPPAGTALAPMTRCASAPRPSKERGLGDYLPVDKGSGYLLGSLKPKWRQTGDQTRSGDGLETHASDLYPPQKEAGAGGVPRGQNRPLEAGRACGDTCGAAAPLTLFYPHGGVLSFEDGKGLSPFLTRVRLKKRSLGFCPKWITTAPAGAESGQSRALGPFPCCASQADSGHPSLRNRSCCISSVTVGNISAFVSSCAFKARQIACAASWAVSSADSGGGGKKYFTQIPGMNDIDSCTTERSLHLAYRKAAHRSGAKCCESGSGSISITIGTGVAPARSSANFWYSSWRGVSASRKSDCLCSNSLSLSAIAAKRFCASSRAAIAVFAWLIAVSATCSASPAFLASAKISPSEIAWRASDDTQIAASLNSSAITPAATTHANMRFQFQPGWGGIHLVSFLSARSSATSPTPITRAKTTNDSSALDSQDSATPFELGIRGNPEKKFQIELAILSMAATAIGFVGWFIYGVFALFTGRFKRG